MKSKIAGGAVVVGGTIPALEAVRSLGNHRIPIVVLHTDGYNDIAQYSRWTSKAHKFLDIEEQPKSILDILERQGQGAWKDWVLFPTGDSSLALLSRCHDHLSRWYRIIAPTWEVTRGLLNKKLTYRAARTIGVDVPRCYGDANMVNASKNEISFPVVVKPSISHLFRMHFGKKLIVAKNRKELLDSIRIVNNAKLNAQIFDLVPGLDTSFFNFSVYIDSSGEPLAGLGMKKLRKSPPLFGVIRAGERAHVPELRESTIDLLRALNWRGMANAEYKLDPRDGRYRLMEVNGRCFLMTGLARKLGINYPFLAWQEHGLNQKNLTAHPNDWDGVWIHLLADIYYGLFYHRIEKLGLDNYLGSYQRPKTFAVWSSKDPKPFIMQWTKAAQRTVHMAFSTNDRKKFASRRQNV